MLKTDIEAACFEYGAKKAAEVRAAAPTMTDTEVVRSEDFIPDWKEGKQPLNAPVRYKGQVYRVLQEHDSTGNPAWNPVDTPALFSICHTKDAALAKPWLAPNGTSGLYQMDECYRDAEGQVWRQIYDGGNEFDAAAMPDRWEAV